MPTGGIITKDDDDDDDEKKNTIVPARSIRIDDDVDTTVNEMNGGIEIDIDKIDDNDNLNDSNSKGYDDNEIEEEDLDDLLANMDIDKDFGILDSLLIHDHKIKKTEDNQLSIATSLSTNVPERVLDNNNIDNSVVDDDNSVELDIGTLTKTCSTNSNNNDIDTDYNNASSTSIGSTTSTKKTKLIGRFLPTAFLRRKSDSTTTTKDTTKDISSTTQLHEQTITTQQSTEPSSTIDITTEKENHINNSNSNGNNIGRLNSAIDDDDDDDDDTQDNKGQTETNINVQPTTTTSTTVPVLPQVFHRDEVFSKRYQPSLDEIQVIKDMETLLRINRLPVVTKVLSTTTTATTTTKTPIADCTETTTLRDQWDEIVHPKSATTVTNKVTSIILYKVECTIGTTDPIEANDVTSHGQLVICPNGILLIQSHEHYTGLFRRTKILVPQFWKGISYSRIHYITIVPNHHIEPTVLPTNTTRTNDPSLGNSNNVSSSEPIQDSVSQNDADYVTDTSASENQLQSNKIEIPNDVTVEQSPLNESNGNNIDTETTNDNIVENEIIEKGSATTSVTPTTNTVDNNNNNNNTSSNIVNTTNITGTNASPVIDDEEHVQCPKFVLQIDLAGGPDETIYLGFDSDTDRQVALECFRKAVRYYHMYNNPTITTSFGWQYQYVYTPAFSMAVSIHMDPLLDQLTKEQLNALDDYNGYGPLHYAIKCNHFPAIRALLEAGADPNLLSKDKKQTPMYIATRDELSSTSILESYGAQKSQLAAIEQGTSGTFFNSIGITQKIVQRKREKEVLTQQIIDDRAAEKKRQAEAATVTMNNNMRLLQQRGEQINEMSNKATGLNDGASEFNSLAGQLKQKMMKKKWYHL